LIYTFSAALRDAIEVDDRAVLTLDLAPGRDLKRLQTDLQHPQGRDSISNHLRRRTGIEGVKAALLHELATAKQLRDPLQLAALIKAVPLTVLAPRPIDEAISTAGGVRMTALTADLMLKQLPGTFVAGEMLDWEAPTGGYLLTACIASGYRTGQGVLRWQAR
jgi:predicted flavoprotein YhiN